MKHNYLDGPFTERQNDVPYLDERFPPTGLAKYQLPYAKYVTTRKLYPRAKMCVIVAISEHVL